MCTVTYIPKSNNQFILTSNRDENAARSPEHVSEVEQYGQRLMFPRDSGAGGSWIAVSDLDKVVCLLNGAFEWHAHRPPYVRSRGVMALDFFNFPDASEFFRSYDFQGMEPFTMVIYDKGKLYDFRWDGKQTFPRSLDVNDYHIWSSATLYDQQARQKREQWFAQWRDRYEEHDIEAIMDFHRHAGEGDPWNDVVMNRNGVVQTVSITNIARMQDSIEMRYHDLLRNNLKHNKIDLRSEVVGLS